MLILEPGDQEYTLHRSPVARQTLFTHTLRQGWGGSAVKASNQPNVCAFGLWMETGELGENGPRPGEKLLIPHESAIPSQQGIKIWSYLPIFLSITTDQSINSQEPHLKPILLLTETRLLSAVKALNEWCEWRVIFNEKVWHNCVHWSTRLLVSSSILVRTSDVSLTVFALLPEGFWGFSVSLVLPCQTCTFRAIAFPMIHLFFVRGASHTLFPW